MGVLVGFGSAGMASSAGTQPNSATRTVQSVASAESTQWARGIDSNPTGHPWDVHFWIIASDRDLINGPGSIVAGAGCAAAIASLGGAIGCAVIANYLITHLDPHGGNSHGVWVAFYPLPYPHITGGRW
jgi:hypothetical protein